MVSPYNLPIPDRIGKYKVLTRIASGGMAEVFLARSESDEGFEKLCAIKQILPHMATNEDFLKMLLDEARIAAQLSHGNIAQTFELARTENSYFIAMEYVLGVSVGEMLTHLRMTESLASPAMATYIMINICSALEYAHAKRDTQGRPLGIIHRDVSPSNVMISIEGDVKLIDFGIVKAVEKLHETKAGNIKGKFGYMSPEQLRAKTVDHRSDVFSAGIMLFELLTNINPFHDSNEAVSMERALKALVPNPTSLIADVPLELEQICLKAVANHPDDRFQSAGDMAQALDTFWRGEPFSRLQMSSWIKATFREHLSKNPWVPESSLISHAGVDSQASNTNEPPAVKPLVRLRVTDNPTVPLSGSKKTVPLTGPTGGGGSYPGFAEISGDPAAAEGLGTAPTMHSKPGERFPELEMSNAEDQNLVTALVNEEDLHQVLTKLKPGRGPVPPLTIPSTQHMDSFLTTQAPRPRSWRDQTRAAIIRQLQGHPRLLVGIVGGVLLCSSFFIFWCIGSPPPLPATPSTKVFDSESVEPPERATARSRRAAEDSPEDPPSPPEDPPPAEEPQGSTDSPQENSEQIEALRALDGARAAAAPTPAAAKANGAEQASSPLKKRVRSRKNPRVKRSRPRKKRTKTKQKAPQIPFEGL